MAKQGALGNKSIVFSPCTAGELLKWKVIPVLLFDEVAVFAGVPLTMKSLPWAVAGSAGARQSSRRRFGNRDVILYRTVTVLPLR